MGFWKDTEATARVVKDGWLDTGDMGYLDEDGVLWLAGRRSDMIKTGAHRIHPAELEEVIAELEGVAECAVVGVEDEVLGQAVKAFVVPASDTIAADTVKAHCQKRLAIYKIPKVIELVTSLPKTASGKVQRAMLAKTHAAEET
jgi:long-chain acyl-CoA synthetase